jgi:hypothetical protein
MITRNPTSRIPKSTPYLMALASCETVSGDTHKVEDLTHVTPIPATVVGPIIEIIEIIVITLRKIMPPENCHRGMILCGEIRRKK